MIRGHFVAVWACIAVIVFQPLAHAHASPTIPACGPEAARVYSVSQIESNAGQITDGSGSPTESGKEQCVDIRTSGPLSISLSNVSSVYSVCAANAANTGTEFRENQFLGKRLDADLEIDVLAFQCLSVYNAFAALGIQSIRIDEVNMWQYYVGPPYGAGALGYSDTHQIPCSGDRHAFTLFSKKDTQMHCFAGVGSMNISPVSDVDKVCAGDSGGESGGAVVYHPRSTPASSATIFLNTQRCVTLPPPLTMVVDEVDITGILSQ